jgi:energy-converting hydrogenase Eha subunit F
MLYKKETEDLETHVSICQERYLQLESRMGTLEALVSKIADELTANSRSMKTTIITSTGTIVVALIGLISAILLK